MVGVARFHFLVRLMAGQQPGPGRVAARGTDGAAPLRPLVPGANAQALQFDNHWVRVGRVDAPAAQERWASAPSLTRSQV